MKRKKERLYSMLLGDIEFLALLRQAFISLSSNKRLAWLIFVAAAAAAVVVRRVL